MATKLRTHQCDVPLQVLTSIYSLCLIPSFIFFGYGCFLHVTKAIPACQLFGLTLLYQAPQNQFNISSETSVHPKVIKSCMVRYSLVLITQKHDDHAHLSIHNDRVQRTRPLNDWTKQLISIKSRPKPLAWLKKRHRKTTSFDLLCFVYFGSTQNTLIEQSLHSLCYNKKTKQTSFFNRKQECK